MDFSGADMYDKCRSIDFITETFMFDDVITKLQRTPWSNWGYSITIPTSNFWVSTLAAACFFCFSRCEPLSTVALWKRPWWGPQNPSWTMVFQHVSIIFNMLFPAEAFWRRSQTLVSLVPFSDFQDVLNIFEWFAMFQNLSTWQNQWHDYQQGLVATDDELVLVVQNPKSLGCLDFVACPLMVNSCKQSPYFTNICASCGWSIDDLIWDPSLSVCGWDMLRSFTNHGGQAP